MGRWSRHPMGSDGALDARDIFMSFADLTEDDSGESLYFFERPEEEVRDLLLSLTLDDIKEYAEQDDIISENKFVIPYTFIEYKAYPTDPEIKKYLLECLDYHEDFDLYGNGDEEKHVKFFKENFEDIISGNKVLEGDEGLFAALADAIESGDEPGLINKTKDN